MSTTSSATNYSESISAVSARKEALTAYWDLSKPRIAVMGLVAVAIGYAMGNVGAWNWLQLCEALLGIGAVWGVVAWVKNHGLLDFLSLVFIMVSVVGLSAFTFMVVRGEPHS